MVEKKNILLILLMISILFLQSCESNNESNIPKVDEPIIDPGDNLEPEIDYPTINELLDDEFGYGVYSTIDNIVRTPLDSAWLKVKSRTEPISVYSAYTEDFEKSYLDSKIYPMYSDKGASYEISNDKSISINGYSLIIDSKGKYKGVYLSGMKYVENASYHVSFDYKVLEGNTGYYFQFRSKSGGIQSDIFTCFSGTEGTSGSVDKLFNLGEYSDYEIMIFPQSNAGKIAIDNIKVTRLNTKPQIKGSDLIGNNNIGDVVTLDYEYFDTDFDKEAETEITWFCSLDKQGLNKILLQRGGTTLTIPSECEDKYLGVDIIPVSIGTDNQAIGKLYEVYLNDSVGNISSKSKMLSLNKGESFTETFANDVDEESNLYFVHDNGVTAYITDEVSDLDGKYLSINSKNSFAGVEFEGLDFEGLGVYQITFDYVIKNKPNNFYIQLRSEDGGSKHDVFGELPISNNSVDQEYSFTFTYKTDDYSDYKLMMFTGSQGGTVLIDNICIERLNQENSSINSTELQIGDKLIENFDDNNYQVLGIDNSQTPNSQISSDSDKVISGNSLYIESSGSFKCVFINEGLIYTNSATYNIKFDYYIIDFIDTIYFQLNSNTTGTIYKEFGLKSEIGTLQSFEMEFTLADTNDYVMQIFPGSGIGKTALIIDNIIIERIE